MLRHYFTLALRNLWKYRTQSIISIVGLAVGLLCFSYSFYINRYMGSIDTNFDNYRRIAEVKVYDGNSPNEGTYSGSPVTVDRELRRWAMSGVEAQTYVGHARLLPHEVEVGDGKRLPYDLRRMEVDTCFARVFTPHIVAGSWPAAARTPNALVLSRSTARRIFGTEAAAVGKSFLLKQQPDGGSRRGSPVYTVQAVMEDLPLNCSLSFMQPLDMLVLGDVDGEIDVNSTDNGWLVGNIYLLLSPQTTPKDINDHIAARGYHPTVFDRPLDIKAMRIGTDLAQQQTFSIAGWITGSMGLLILLVGLINFFLFLIGSFLNRSREFSILKMEGADSRRLFGMLFTQTLLVVLPAALLAFWGIELLNGRLDFNIRSILQLRFPSGLLMTHLLQYLLLLLVVCGAICTLVTLRIRRLSIQTGIYGGRRRRGKSVGRNLSLAVQFFICWLFVSLTVAFFLQSRTIERSLLPTLTMQEKADILIVPMDYTFLPLAERQALVARISGDAGVQEVMVTGEDYLAGVRVTGIYYGEDRQKRVDGSMKVVPPNFFSFMKLPIVQGRPMATAGEAVADVVLQNQLQHDVPGMTLSLHDQTAYTVVGVSSPFVVGVYDYYPVGSLFVLSGAPDDERRYAYCYLKCYPEQAGEVAARVEAVCRERFPESVEVRVPSLLDAIREQQAMENYFKNIILFLAVVSLLITLFGVYSAITLDTERRRKEVAIRKVNGARAPQIATLFARLYLILLTATAAVAFPLVYGVLRMWKQSYVTFFHAGIPYWLGIFLAVAAFTGVTIGFRIWRIARSNPAETIKAE